MLSVAALALTGALAAAALVKLFGISFLGLPRSEHALRAKEAPRSMLVGTGIPVALCLLIGLFPMLLLRPVDAVASGLTGLSVLGRMEGGF
jgi:formate hydrogenlyase subunit 3/multisubunit Na+/H+ antiporter MnhD subunit